MNCWCVRPLNEGLALISTLVGTEENNGRGVFTFACLHMAGTHRIPPRLDRELRYDFTSYRSCLGKTIRGSPTVPSFLKLFFWRTTYSPTFTRRIYENMSCICVVGLRGNTHELLLNFKVALRKARGKS